MTAKEKKKLKEYLKRDVILKLTGFEDDTLEELAGAEDFELWELGDEVFVSRKEGRGILLDEVEQELDRRKTILQRISDDQLIELYNELLMKKDNFFED